MVDTHVVAIERVTAECNAIDAHELGTIFNVLDDVIHCVARRHGVCACGPRRCLNTDYTAAACHRSDHIVGLHPQRIEQPAGSGMADNDRSAAVFGGIDRCAVSRVRDINNDASLVHDVNSCPPKRG